MKKAIFFALALVAGVLAFSSCTNDQNSPEIPNPVDNITINPQDWHEVPQAGCTIELDDISLTVPANTFPEDTKLSVTKLKRGSYYGGYEASNFYYITVPSEVNRSITVKLAPSKEGAKVQYAALAPFHRKTTNENVVGDIELECSYDNDECTIMLPISDNGSGNPDLWIIVGLVEDNSSKFSSNGSAARKLASLTDTPAGQVKNVKWHFAMDTWTWIKLTDSEGAKIKNLMNKLNPIVENALTKIHEVGFALDEERNIPICFIRDPSNPEIFGNFCQGFWNDRSSYVELNLSTLEASDDPNVWGRTCIHELLHYFQSNYDKRYPEFKIGGEEDILNEAASVWAEQFMNDGQLDAKFVGGHIVNFLRGFQISENGNKPSEQGYAMSSMLYYLTSPIGGMDIYGINKNSIVELFQIWKDNPSYRGTSYYTLNKWFANHNCAFMNIYYDKFLLSLLTGKVFDLVKGGHGEIAGIDGVRSITSFNTDRTHTYGKRTCLSYGCAVDAATVHMRESFEGKEIIIQQNKPDVATYLIVGDDKYNYEYYKQSAATLDNPLVIAGEEIDAMLKGSHITNFYFVTINSFGSKNESEVTCTVQDKKEEPKVQIKSVNFSTYLTMGTEEKNAVVDFIVDLDKKKGDSINVNMISTGYAVKATNSSGNKRIYFEVNTRGADPVMTKMTVNYTKPEDYVVSLSLTNLPRTTRYYDYVHVFEGSASENTFNLSDFSYEGAWGSFNTIVPGESARATVKVYFDNDVW